MDVYVARQPIFDVHMQVVAYELLFRNNNINEFVLNTNLNPTLNVIRNSFSVIGIEKLTGGKRAFINFDDELIKSGIIEEFPKESITVEILETVEPDESITECCKKLKESGYVLALDDFEYNDKFEELLEYIDIIKVDFLITKGSERKDVISRIREKNKDIKFLAEKVETEEEFCKAILYGYSYFQGYFFCRPVIITGKDISGYKFNYVKLLQELDGDEININAIADMIKNDVSLSYKLLRAANSAIYSLKRKITSLNDAIMIIGINELRKWIFIITLQDMSENSIEELVKVSLIRAFFGELLSQKINEVISSFDAFLTGMFSLMDALMNIPIEDILNELPLSKNVKEALLKRNNVLSELLKLIMEYENSNWDEVNLLTAKFELDEGTISDCYLKAIQNIHSLESL